MLQSIDPSVADENDPTSVIPELDMYDPANGWRPWPEPCSYDPDWLDAVLRRAAGTGRRASTRGRANSSTRRPSPARGCGTSTAAATTGGGCASGPSTSTTSRSTAPSPTPRTSTSRIEPDDRPLGSLFAFPDPFDANYGWGGLARTMTTRGWLSTWSASSKARLATTMPDVHVPVLVVHRHRGHRDPDPPGPGDRRRGRLRRRHVRRDEGRAALPRGSSARGDADRRRLDRRPLPLSPETPRAVGGNRRGSARPLDFGRVAPISQRTVGRVLGAGQRGGRLMLGSPGT